MTSELPGSMWYERKMEDFVGQNVRAQGATTQPRAGKIFCVGDTSFENYCIVCDKFWNFWLIVCENCDKFWLFFCIVCDCLLIVIANPAGITIGAKMAYIYMLFFLITDIKCL